LAGHGGAVGAGVETAARKVVVPPALTTGGGGGTGTDVVSGSDVVLGTDVVVVVASDGAGRKAVDSGGSAPEPRGPATATGGGRVAPQADDTTVMAAATAIATRRRGAKVIVSRAIVVVPIGSRSRQRRYRDPGQQSARHGVVAVVTLSAALVVAGCGATTSSHPPGAGAATAKAATTAVPTPKSVGTTPAPSTTASPVATSATTAKAAATPSTTTAGPPAFVASVSAVDAAELGATWHPGCPVGFDQLRLLRLGYWGFDGRSHVGTMVVNATVANAATAVFRALYDERFPIAEMVPEAAYGGDDNTAAAADDTSGFNCRDAVASGPPQWSVHAYGEAIDVNDVQNPYVEGSTIIPPAGVAYLDRSSLRPGMAVPGGELVHAFASVGWLWGGRWTSSPDYQHFSATGG
jgi:hypothetical protein